MKTLSGMLTGRLGNLLFQYAFFRGFAERYGYELCLPPWVGEQIFNLPHTRRPDGIKIDMMLDEATYQNQVAMDFYTRKQVREWFQFRPTVLEHLQILDVDQPEIIFNRREQPDCPLIVHREAYRKAAIEHGYDPERASWETDVSPTRLDRFYGNPDATGLGTTWVSLPSFYRLMNAKVLFRANSTFSWWAATLGDGKVFSPVVKGRSDGYCDFVEGNWPLMSDCAPNTDLHLKPE